MYYILLWVLLAIIVQLLLILFIVLYTRYFGKSILHTSLFLAYPRTEDVC